METKELTITIEPRFEVIQQVGGDESVIAAARVSVRGQASIDSWATPAEEAAGLINFLMRNRHGTPFEHNLFTFYVQAGIFVFREFHRHRIGWSYNEESGRYKQLDPVFYVPGPERHLQTVPGSKTMEYKTIAGTRPQQHLVRGAVEAACEESYLTYVELLENGIIREVARIVLPVTIMSTCIVSCNARSLMHFLSLRQRHDDAKFPSKPMKEINLVADGYERCLQEHAPLVHAAFTGHGRVAP